MKKKCKDYIRYIIYYKNMKRMLGICKKLMAIIHGDRVMGNLLSIFRFPCNFQSNIKTLKFSDWMNDIYSYL